MIKITEKTDQRIQNYFLLKDLRRVLNQEIFIADGSTLVLNLLERGIRPLSFFCKKDFFNKNITLLEKFQSQTPFYYADKNILNEIIGFNSHQGVMAEFEIPAPIKLENLKTPIIALNNVVNSENVGSVMRNMVALGFKSLLIDNQTAHPFLRRSARVSMGNCAFIDYCITQDFKEALQFFKNNQTQIIGTSLEKDSTPIHLLKVNKKSLTLFGSEGNGIGQDLVSFLDVKTTIPMKNHTDSLNISNASAIFLYEISKNINL